MAETGGLFVINAETGDMSQFTTTFGTIAAAATLPNNGSFSFISSGNWDREYAYKNLGTTYTEIYARHYLYMDNITPAGNWHYYVLMTLSSGIATLSSNRMAWFGVGSNGAGVLDRWLCSGYGLTGAQSTVGFALDQWFCVELHWAQSPTSGGIQCWIDSTSICNEMNVDTSTGHIDIVHLGWGQSGTLPTTAIVYQDDLKIAQTGPIGAYAESGGGIAKCMFGTRTRYLNG